MKKVMLVDDEIVIRENIRSCVDWEKEGFLYCGDASDGETALPLIEKWLPDILITDIKMPFMDGIELSKLVRQRMPQVKIVILSGHDEFAYARTALRLGVEEYILKPIGAADLIQVLQAVSRKIDRERQEKSASAYTREKLLGDLCGGLITTADAVEAAAALSIPLFARYYAAAVWDLRGADAAPAVLDADCLRAADEALEDVLRPLAGVWGFKRSRTEHVWIVTGDSADGVQDMLGTLQQQVLPGLYGRLPCQVVLGVGSVQDRLQGIHASFLEADEDRNLKRLTQLNALALQGLGAGPGVPALPDRARFAEFLTIGSRAEWDAFAARFAEGLQSIDWKSSPYGYYLLNDLTLETIRAAKAAFRLAEVSEETIEGLQQRIREVRSLESCIAYLTLLAERFWQWRADASDKYGELIGKVKAFIRERYADDRLSLQDAADHVKVSPGHLSKVFSHETGQTFIEYLTQTRIRKAMELLQTTRDKTYEVAYQVGYNDAHYFSNLFKKMTGMTAREFRRQGGAWGPAAEGEPDPDEHSGQVS